MDVDCKTSRRPPVWEIAVQLALMASFCSVLFPTRCLGYNQHFQFIALSLIQM